MTEEIFPCPICLEGATPVINGRVTCTMADCEDWEDREKGLPVDVWNARYKEAEKNWRKKFTLLDGICAHIEQEGFITYHEREKCTICGHLLTSI